MANGYISNKYFLYAFFLSSFFVNSCSNLTEKEIEDHLNQISNVAPLPKHVDEWNCLYYEFHRGREKICINILSFDSSFSVCYHTRRNRLHNIETFEKEYFEDGYFYYIAFNLMDTVFAYKSISCDFKTKEFLKGKYHYQYNYNLLDDNQKYFYYHNRDSLDKIGGDPPNLSP